MSLVTTMANDYANKSQIQQTVQVTLTPNFEKSLNQMIYKHSQRFQNNDQPFVIADLGCADGKNSIINLTTILKCIRKVNSELPIIIYLNDTPATDLEKSAEKIKTGLKDFENYQIKFVARSFYERLFPQNTVDLFISYVAVHWCTKIPENNKQSMMHFFMGEQSEMPSDTQQMFKIARQDLNVFMTNREIQLKPHGRMIISTLSIPKHIKHVDRAYKLAQETISKCLRQVLVQFGFQEVVDKVALTMVCRQQRHYQNFFETHQTNLKMLSYEDVDIPDPFANDYELNKDKQLYVNRYSNVARGYSEGVFYNILKNSGYKETQIKQALKRLYQVKVPAQFLRRFQDIKGGRTYSFMCIQKN